MSGTVNNATGASIASLGRIGDEINIPELLMSIQIERSSLLDGQIKGQMSDMQARNNWLKDSNSALAALRAARPATDTGTVDSTTVNFTDHTGQTQSVASWAAANGMTTALAATPEQKNALADAKAAQTALQNSATNWTSGSYAITKSPTFTNAQGETTSCYDWAKTNNVSTVPTGWGAPGAMTPDQSGNYVMTRASLQAAATAAAAVVTTNQAAVDAANHPTGTQIDSAISTFKATIDTINSQSQMDMVRLQGLMDKRNQAFDMMTNTLAKAGKSIDDITGNMR